MSYDVIDGRYFTGCLVPDKKPERLALYEASQPMLSLAEITEMLASENRTPARQRFPASQWIRNQGGRGSCFPPGTLIRMGDGTQKPIEEVKLLDEVLTAEGRVRRVMRTMVRPHSGKVYRVCVWGNRHIRCTQEHPFLTQDGYVSAENLTKNHWIAIPRFAPQKHDILDVHSVLPKPVGVKKKTYWKKKDYTVTQQIPGKAAVVIHKATVPDLIELDYDFGWLIGMFCAEGNLWVGKATFSLNANEKDTLAKGIAERFAKYNVVAHITSSGTKCSVNIHSKQWVMLLEQLTGTGSKHKQLHNVLTGANKDCLRGIIDGWQAGDGIGDPDRNGGVSISHGLAMNMYDIANALGYMPTIETLEPRINPKHKIKSRQMRYLVAWPREPKEPVFSKRRQDEKTVWRKVAKLEEEEYSGFVYNLEVEDDHSYVAEGLGVHNCNGYAGAWALSRARVIAGLDFIPLSGEFLYSMINGGVDRGSMLDDGMKAIQERGVAQESLVKHETYLWAQMSQEARADAPRFKAFECYRAETELGLASGLALGFVGVVAVHASNAWSSLSGGVSRPSNGPGNHAVVCQDVRSNGSQLQFDIANSWGQRWGDSGHTWNTWKDHFVQTVKYHDFYLIRGVTDDPQDPAPEPKE